MNKERPAKNMWEAEVDNKKKKGRARKKQEEAKYRTMTSNKNKRGVNNGAAFYA